MTTPTPGTPRWVKITGLLVVLAATALVLVLVFGGGEHGPGRHGALSGDDPYGSLSLVAGPAAQQAAAAAPGGRR